MTELTSIIPSAALASQVYPLLQARPAEPQSKVFNAPPQLLQLEPGFQATDCSLQLLSLAWRNCSLELPSQLSASSPPLSASSLPSRALGAALSSECQVTIKITAGLPRRGVQAKCKREVSRGWEGEEEISLSPLSSVFIWIWVRGLEFQEMHSYFRLPSPLQPLK